MIMYYVTFMISLLISAILIDYVTTGWLNYMKSARQAPFSRTIGTMIIVTLTAFMWTVFLCQSNKVQKSSTLPIRPSIFYSKWHTDIPPQNGRIVRVVFSPGDTTLVRWMEHREIFDVNGDMSNYGPGWAAVDYQEGYPMNDPIAWQFP